MAGFAIVTAAAQTPVPSSVATASLTDRVRSVPSGETVNLATGGVVRLIGLEMPTAFNDRAMHFLTGLLLDRTVTVTRDTVATDDRNRQLVYVHLEDGTFVNREIVRMGYAHAYLAFPFRHEDALRAAALEARDQSRGVWAFGLPGQATVPPRGAVVPATAAGLISTPSTSGAAAPPTSTPAPRLPSSSSGCCRVCSSGKPCGNSCIARSATCRQPPGCAC